MEDCLFSILHPGGDPIFTQQASPRRCPCPTKAEDPNPSLPVAQTLWRMRRRPPEEDIVPLPDYFIYLPGRRAGRGRRSMPVRWQAGQLKTGSGRPPPRLPPSSKAALLMNKLQREWAGCLVRGGGLLFSPDICWPQHLLLPMPSWGERLHQTPAFPTKMAACYLPGSQPPEGRHGAMGRAAMAEKADRTGPV